MDDGILCLRIKRCKERLRCALNSNELCDNGDSAVIDTIIVAGGSKRVYMRIPCLCVCCSLSAFGRLISFV